MVKIKSCFEWNKKGVNDDLPLEQISAQHINIPKMKLHSHAFLILLTLFFQYMFQFLVVILTSSHTVFLFSFILETPWPHCNSSSGKHCPLLYRRFFNFIHLPEVPCDRPKVKKIWSTSVWEVLDTPLGVCGRYVIRWASLSLRRDGSCHISSEQMTDEGVIYSVWIKSIWLCLQAVQGKT